MKNVPIAVPIPNMLTSLIVAYVLGWFLTYGHTWNHFECGERQEFIRLCDGNRVMESVFTALIWPVYWGLEGAKAVTR